MKINQRLSIECDGLGSRALARLAEHGALTEAANAIGVSPARLSNLLREHSRGCPLEHVLALENHLGVDLLGLDRQEIVAALRNLADRVEENRH